MGDPANGSLYGGKTRLLVRMVLSIAAGATLLPLLAVYPWIGAALVTVILLATWAKEARAIARVALLELEAESCGVSASRHGRAKLRAAALGAAISNRVDAWLIDVLHIAVAALLVWGFAVVWQSYHNVLIKVLSCLVYAGFAVLLHIDVYTFLANVRLLGLRSLQAVRAMHQIAQRTRDHQLFMVLVKWCVGVSIVVAGGSWLLGWGLQLAWSFPFLAMGLFVWIDNCMPPVILLLTTSNQSTITLQKALLKNLMPYRVVALLNIPRGWSDELENHALMASNCLRTGIGPEWVETVDRLLGLVAIVVMDTRVATPGVMHELNRILLAENSYKAVILTGPNGEHEALDAAGVGAAANLPFVTEEELVPTLRRMVASREMLPRAGKTAVARGS